MRLIILLLAGLVLGSTTFGQGDSALLDRDFVFQNGIYYDLTSLKTNRPDKTLEVLAGALVLAEDEFRLKVEILYPKGRPDLSIDMDSVAAICLNGIPYIRVKSKAGKTFTEYAGLQIRGRLSYFSYQETVPDSVLIKAYNPLTGQPFRQQKVSRPKRVEVQKVLDINTGEVVDFELSKVLNLFKEDPSLQETLKNLSPEEAADKLLKCITIFDDRHEVWLPIYKEDE